MTARTALIAAMVAALIPLAASGCRPVAPACPQDPAVCLHPL